MEEINIKICQKKLKKDYKNISTIIAKQKYYGIIKKYDKSIIILLKSIDY